MKLIVQIPCYNEAENLAAVLDDLPRSLAGVDVIETMVIDDGSSDGTAEEARRLGVDHVIAFSAHRGLARAFMAGLEAGLKRGADLIVNTDGDGQYRGADIAGLIAPILAGKAEMVVGCRPVERIAHFSRLKKRLQRWGSDTVRRLSGVDVADATSGFRAFSREAALRLNVMSDFTYTIETLIQAGKKSIATASVPVGVNPPRRESRLFRGNLDYLRRAIPAMVRIYATYEPLKVFASLGMLFLLLGGLPIARFIYLYAVGSGAGHVQSLVLGAALVLIGFQTMVVGMLADLISTNRRLIEEAVYRMRMG